MQKKPAQPNPRVPDSPYVADWFAVSMRWMVVVGASISLGLENRILSPAFFIIILLILWNIALTWMAGVSKRWQYHRQINVLVDVLLAGIFFILQGGILSLASWVILLPVLTGAIYFDHNGSLTAAGGVILFLGADIFIHATPPLVVGIAALVTLLLAGVFGFLSHELISELRIVRKKQIQVRETKQKIEIDRMRAIYGLTSTLSMTLNYKKVLEQAIDLSAYALYSESGAAEAQNEQETRDVHLLSAILLFQNDQLIIGSARRLSQSDMRASFPGKTGLLGNALEEGEAIVSAKNMAEDPELNQIIALHECRSTYCFPMRNGLNIYGVMLYAHPSPNYFNQERRDILDIIGRQAVIAIQNARLYQDLADEKERMTEAQEEARKKLARDLHDGPTQSIAALAMRVNLARRIMERNPQSAAEELEKIEDLARRTTKEMRHMLFTLRPLVLESQGLTAALQSIADKTKETYNQDVVVQVDEKITEELEMGKSGVIFYIAEEAVNNARKHAQAAQIWIRLTPLAEEPEIAVLEIGDNGLGFDVEAVNKAYDKRGSLGMVNLRERAELVNGLLQIESAPGKGTRVRVYIPLSEEAADKLRQGKA